jgi:hypothetical protein
VVLSGEIWAVLDEREVLLRAGDVLVQRGTAMPGASAATRRPGSASSSSTVRAIYHRTVRDYWLSKLFYDLQQPALAAQLRAEPETLLCKYPITAEVREAIARNDVPFLAQRTNAYLLRYYFFAVGMKDDEFIRRLNHG